MSHFHLGVGVFCVALWLSAVVFVAATEVENSVLDQITKPCTVLRQAEILSKEKQIIDEHELWFCELDLEDALRTGLFFVPLDDELIKWIMSPDGPVVTSGESTIFTAQNKLKDGKLDFQDNTPIVDTKKKGVVDTKEGAGRRRHHRNLRHSSSGDRSVLIAHVTALDSSPTLSAAQLSDDVFGTVSDAYNLVSQYKACSYNKLRFYPYSADDVDDLTNGVLSIQLDINVYGRSDSYVVNEVRDEVNSLLGLDYYSIDHIMICLPYGVTRRYSYSWVAWAYIGGTISVYNDDRISSLLIQMHEVGHNLRLGHSTEDGSEYGDDSGNMGNFLFADDEPRMCFNGANSWLLGWYQDREKDIDPLKEEWTGRLLGVSDYNNSATSSDRVLLTILEYQFLEDRLFVAFNRKAGINIGTGEYGDKVIVTKLIPSSSGSTYFKTDVVEVLGAGQSLTLPDFPGGFTVSVKVNSITLAAFPGYANVTVSKSRTCPHDRPCTASEAEVGGGPVQMDTVSCTPHFYGTVRSAYVSFVAPPSGCAELDIDFSPENPYEWERDHDLTMTLYEAENCHGPLFTPISSKSASYYDDDLFNNDDGNDSDMPRIIEYDLTPGKRYWVEFDGTNIFATIEISDPCNSCPNDHPCNATEVMLGEGPVAIETVKCTGETLDGRVSSSSAFIAFKAPSGCVNITHTFLRGDEDGDDSVDILLYRGDDCNSSSSFKELDNTFWYWRNPRIVVDDRWLDPGRTYWVMVDGRYGDQVYGTIELTDPCGTLCPHDSPCTAAEAIIGNGPVHFNTSQCHQRHRSHIPTSSYYASYSKTAFVSFVTPESGCIEIDADLTGGRYSYSDVAMSLYSAKRCDGNFTELAFNDDFDINEPRITRTDLNPGEKYWVMLYASSSTSDEVYGTVEVTDPCDVNRCPTGNACNAVEVAVGGGPVGISTVGCRLAKEATDDYMDGGSDYYINGNGNVRDLQKEDGEPPSQEVPYRNTTLPSSVNRAFAKFVAPSSGCAAIQYTFIEGEPTYSSVGIQLYAASDCNFSHYRELNNYNIYYEGRNRRLVADDRWLTPGKTYWIAVTAYEARGMLEVTDPCDSSVCPNDSACFAAEVIMKGDPITLSTVGCHGEPPSDLPFSGWYIKSSAFATFVAGESGCVEIDWDDKYQKCQYFNDVEMSIYTSSGGCDEFPFFELAYNDNFDRNEPRIIIDDGSLTTGQRYWIMVDGRYCDQHTGTIEIKDPCDPSLCPNDTPCNAANATSDGDAVLISTFGCTGETSTGTIVQTEDCTGNKTIQDNTMFVSFSASSNGCIDIQFTFLEGEDFDDEVAMSLLAAESCSSPYFYTLDSSNPYAIDPEIVMLNRDLVPGRRYWVMIYGVSGDEVIGLLKLSDPCGKACPNDSPCFATEAAVGGDPHYISTIGCHAEKPYVLPGLSSSLENSAWAKFTAPITGCVEVEWDYVTSVESDNTDVEMALVYGDTCEAMPLSIIGYSDNKDELEPRIIIDDGSLMPGAEYYIVVDGVFGAEVDGYLNVFDPCSDKTCPNDDPCDAVVAKVNGPRVPISTMGCTGEDEANIPYSGNTKKSAWMTFTAPASGCIEIRFFYTYVFDFTTEFLMALFSSTGCDSFPFQEEAHYFVKDSGVDPHIKLDGSELVPGKMYWVMVGEFLKGEEMSGLLQVTDPCA